MSCAPTIFGLIAFGLVVAAPAFVAGLALRPRQRAERDFQGEHVE